MYKFNYLILSSLLMTILNGCNSAFPENKSSVNSNNQKSSEKVCVESTPASKGQKVPQAFKTYKIIGE